ncbi:MAG: hypothetical protein AB7Q42_01675 [Acidimicrobiia bacterium]
MPASHTRHARHPHRRALPTQLHSAAEAIDVILTAVDLDRPATVCLTLDDGRWPIGCIVIDHDDRPDDPDDVLQIGDRIADYVASAPEIGSVVLASIRPTAPCDPADADRLAELTMHFDAIGVDLIEWFVVHALGIAHLRAAVGEPSRW